MKINWNLPPGVTARDLDPVMVECPDCCGRGEFLQAGDITRENTKSCDRCGGTGEIPKERGEGE
jgi:DnaJ-class molecular chaperone